MFLCKGCHKLIKDKDIKTRMLDNLCWCKICYKRKQNERNQSYAHKRDKVMASTDRYKLGHTYSTKGLNERDTMAVFMGAILECEHAGIKQ